MTTWTQAFANSKRTSCVTEGPATNTLYCQWYTTFEAYVHPHVQPVADDEGSLYIATSAGLHKIDASDGSVLWSFPGRFACTPAWGNGALYAALTDDRIVALDDETGLPDWTWAGVAKAGFDADVLLSADGTRVVAGCRDGYVYCLTAATGALAWQYPSADSGPLAPFDSPAAEHDGSVYILCNDMYLRRLSLRDGELLDTSAKLLGEAFRGMPPVIDSINGLIYIPTGAPLAKKGWSDGITWRTNDQMDFWAGATGGDLCGVASEDGKDVYDYSVKGDGAQSVTEFVTDNPDRVTMQVLHLSSLDEYDLGATYGNCRVPFMATHTNSGSRWPCAVSDSGDVYVTNWRANPQTSLASSAGIFKWDVGTPRFTNVPYTLAWDEPLWFTLSNDGDYLHASLTSNRAATGFNTSSFAGNTYWGYSDIGEGLGAIAQGWDDNIIWTTLNPVGATWSSDGINRNGNQGMVHYTALLVPIGNYLFALASNTLICLGTSSAESGTRAANVAAVDFMPNVTANESDALERLESALAFVDTATPEHYRPGFVNNLNSEVETSASLVPGYGVYGRWIDETLIPLLRAYPHVSGALQSRIRAYATVEFEAYSCLSNHSWIPNDGSGHGVREWSNQTTSNIRGDLAIPIDTFYAYEGYGSVSNWWDIRPQHWYVAWLMCSVLEPDDDIDAATLYARMKTAYDGGITSDYAMLQAHSKDATFADFPQALNANLAGLYGRWQLALLAGETAEAATAKSTLDYYIAFWNDSFSKDLPASWSTGFDSDVPHKRNSMLCRNWLWLVPEIATLIKADDGYDQEAIDQALAEQMANNPFWDLRVGIPMLGEGAQQFLYDYEAILRAVAYFRGASRAQLAPYLDAPIFAKADYQYIDALTLYLAAPGEPQSTIEISPSRILSPGDIRGYGRFEIAFDITGSEATNMYWPLDSDTPPGIEPSAGISVDAQLLPPGVSGWENAVTVPCFYHQPVKQVAGRLIPTGDAEWRFRFSTGVTGEWQYRIRATDSGGSAISDQSSFTVIPSDSPGYLRINERGFFETSDGAPFNDQMVNLGGGYWPWSTAVTARAQLAELADAGVRFMRWFPTGEAGANVTPFGDDMTSSWGFGNGHISRSEVDQGRSWSFVPYFYSYQHTALERDLDYALQFRVRVTGSRQVTFKVSDESGRELVSKVLQGPLEWETHTVFFNSGGGGNVTVWMVNGLSEEDDTEGVPYVSYIGLHATENGQAGPNILARANPDTHLYVDAVGAAYLDLVLEESAARGIYHRLTLFHKNDRVLCSLQLDGDWGDWSVSNFYSATGQAARWLELAYVRYFLARWGYSPSIHSLELANENMLESASYDSAFAIAQYIKDNAPRPILQSNSFWGWYVDPFWADATRADLMDYADKHWYESTKPAGDEGELIGADWADSAASVRKAYRRFQQYEARYRPGQPILRGETGTFDETGVHPLLASDVRGVYLHKMLWANVGCVRHGVAGEWFANLIQQNKLWSQFGAYHAFISDEPFNREDFVGIGSDLDADAAVLVSMTTGNLRAWGQRHPERNHVILWVDNLSHTWVNDVNQTNLVPATGTITLQGLEPARYEIQYWNTNTGVVTGTVRANTSAQGQLAIRLSSLTTDTALKIDKVAPLPPPPPVQTEAEIIRAVAWKGLFPAGGVTYDEEGTFAAGAKERGLGIPTTSELTFQDLRIQGFAGGILYVNTGKPDELQFLVW